MSTELKKSGQGHDSGERGYGVGQKASWIGAGFVLAMEGSIVWLNVWRTVESSRGTSSYGDHTKEADEFSEMQG